MAPTTSRSFSVSISPLLVVGSGDRMPVRTARARMRATCCEESGVAQRTQPDRYERGEREHYDDDAQRVGVDALGERDRAEKDERGGGEQARAPRLPARHGGTPPEHRADDQHR